MKLDTLSSQPNIGFPEPIDRLHGLLSLLRYYLAWRPVIAEHKNASLAALWAARAQSDRWNEGGEVWIETHDRFGDVTYMFWGLDGGKHSTRRPEGVSEEQILKVFETNEPSSSLGDFVAQLVATLDEQNDEQLAWKRQLEPALPQLLALGKPQFELELQWDELGQLCHTFVGSGEDHPALELCKEYVENLNDRFIRFAAPGEWAGCANLIYRLYKTFPDVVRFRRFIFASSHLDHELVEFVALARMIIDEILNDETNYEAVLNVISEVQAEAENLQSKLLQANSLGEFYGTHYVCCSLLWPTYLLYKYILDTAPPADDIARRQLAARCGITEEFMVHSYTALEADFGNHVGANDLEPLRRRVAEIRAAKGDLEAEQRARHAIEIQLLYPHFWKDYILGKTDTIPTRAPTKPIE